jgi:hypothetical protein
LSIFILQNRKKEEEENNYTSSEIFDASFVDIVKERIDGQVPSICIFLC